MSNVVPPFKDLIANTSHTAYHLELRDVYTPQSQLYVDWLAGTAIVPEEHADWFEIVGEAVGRGVDWRRARVVSEPVTDFIRFEWEAAGVINTPAGEKVRWLPRARASDLLLPGNDFWVFDNRLVRFTCFAGDGSYGPHELTDDPAVVKLCTDAFAAVWERSIEHADYEPVWHGSALRASA
jgi:hypothetical protein